MSAYICNPEHIGLLAAYAATRDQVIYEWKLATGNADTAANVAKQLLLANIKSVRTRYPDAPVAELPGPGLDLDDQVLAVQAYARHYLTRTAKDKNGRLLGLVDILKIARCYDYNACEPDDWLTSLAARQVQWIIGRAISDLPGYEDAPWSWSEPAPLKSVEALYR